MSDTPTPPPLTFSLRSIKVADLHPDPSQPRKKRNEQADKELAESMRLHNMLQTILVREEEGKFLIVNGERRWGAASTLGWEDVNCLVTTAGSKQALVLHLIENIQREDLCPADLAAHLNVLMSQYQEEDNKASIRALAALIGKSPGWVSEHLALSRLPAEVQALKDSNTVKNSRVLIGLSKLNETNPTAAARLIKEIENGKTVSVDLINEMRGSQRQKRAAPKDEVQRTDLPSSMFAEVKTKAGEESPVAPNAAQPDSTGSEGTTNEKPVIRKRKKKVVDLAKLLGVSDDLPPEDLLEAFAEAYAKLVAEYGTVGS